jgi:hypothetical protein
VGRAISTSQGTPFRNSPCEERERERECVCVCVCLRVPTCQPTARPAPANEATQAIFIPHHFPGLTQRNTTQHIPPCLLPYHTIAPTYLHSRFLSLSLSLSLSLPPDSTRIHLFVAGRRPSPRRPSARPWSRSFIARPAHRGTGEQGTPEPFHRYTTAPATPATH